MRTNLVIIQDHYAASAHGDLVGMLADLSPEARWTEMEGFPCAGTYVGPDAVVANVFQRLDAEFEGYAFHLDRLFDAGDTILATGHYSGTHRATGKAFRCRVAHVWQLVAGRIAAFEQFTDTLLVQRAMH